jgi:hypothetical protein
VLFYRRRQLPRVLACAREHGGHAGLFHLTSRAADHLIRQIRTDRGSGRR